jgi:hypothetical protein
LLLLLLLLLAGPLLLLPVLLLVLGGPLLLELLGAGGLPQPHLPAVRQRDAAVIYKALPVTC